MKKFLPLFMLAFAAFTALAQAPEAFKFQTVIRDGDGNLLPNQEVTLKFLIHEDAPDGNMVYSEQHQVTTNPSGLVNLQIGNGETLTGAFVNINWGNHQYFLEEQIDIGNTGTFQVFGTVQLLSVPYALHAKTAGNGIQSMSTEERDAINNPHTGMTIFNSTTNCLNYWNGVNWFEACGGCTPQPSTANAGPDQNGVSDTITALDGNVPTYGTGIWSIISGVGGTIIEPSNPTSTFIGNLGESYVLEWEITNSCGESSDFVAINFATTYWICGFPITDERDGKNYQTVEIGDQCWMAENLNVGSFILDNIYQTDNQIFEKYCYMNNSTNCDIYGGLYQWDEMMQYIEVQGQQGICPEGWHLPTNAEWTYLIDLLGGELIAGGEMKETGTAHWLAPNVGATNNSGFTALPGGIKFNIVNFSYIGFRGVWWSSTLGENNTTFMQNITSDAAYITTWENPQNILNNNSVRCLKGDVALNQAPSPINSEVPENESINQPINLTLEWSCSDPEDDPLTFDVYFGLEDTPPIVSTEQSNTIFDPGTLENETVYFWKIVAHDDHNNATEGPTWSFITNTNQPPNLPSNPYPQNDKYVTSLDLVISWECTDPEGDSLTYDIFFGDEATPPQVATNITDTFYNPGLLGVPVNYFWQIVAHDNHGNTIEGEIWSFTTSNQAWNCWDTLVDDRNGHEYPTIKIGGRCWMAENLTYLPEVSPSSQGSNTVPYYYVYDYQGTSVPEAKASSNYQTYGVLYNWPASLTACPVGWYLPTDEEWTELTDYVSSQPEYTCNGDTTYIAKALAATTAWNSSLGTCTVGYNLSANNATGFSGLPGGSRGTNGNFNNIGDYGHWWSSTDDYSDKAFWRYTAYNFKFIWGGSNTRSCGNSVRCVKNQPPLPPYNPYPADGAENQPANFILFWSCSDPKNDPITYDLYFGAEPNPSQLATGIADTFYFPGTLEYSTTYYWQIVAHDDYGNTTEGDVWNFTTMDEPDWQCGDTLFDVRDGQSYETILIGYQCWMAENIGYLPAINPPSEGSLTDPHYYVYDYQGTSVPEARATINYQTYGVLYNWPATLTACPEGWHLPTDTEWTALTDYVSNQPDYICNGNTDYIAKALAATTNWNSYSSTCAVGNNLSTNNATGFSGFPGGFRTDNVNFYNVGHNGYWWSSTEHSSSNAYLLGMDRYSAYVTLGLFDKNLGLSVRCLKNGE